MEMLASRSPLIPAQTPRATTTGTIFFSLLMEPKGSFQEALSTYKEAKEVMACAVPCMSLLNNDVSMYATINNRV